MDIPTEKGIYMETSITFWFIVAGFISFMTGYIVRGIDEKISLKGKRSNLTKDLR